jgi:hypothetical protein
MDLVLPTKWFSGLIAIQRNIIREKRILFVYYLIVLDPNRFQNIK